MNKSINLILALLVASALVASGSPAPDISKEQAIEDIKNYLEMMFPSKGNNARVINDREINNDDDLDSNKLLSYEPMMNKIKHPEIDAFLVDVEKGKYDQAKPAIVKASTVQKENIEPTDVMDQKKVPSNPLKDLDNASSDRNDKIRLISMNSREVRLMGPDQKEVEMKDDAATKVAVAMENLRKEATELWGQVNTKLDKGWVDFKSMVENAVESAKKKSSSDKSSPSSSSTMDEISAAADTTVKTIKDQAEIAGTKIRGFFNNLGVNI